MWGYSVGLDFCVLAMFVSTHGWVGGLGRAGEWCVGWVGGAYDGMSVSPQRLVQTGRTCGHMT